MSMVMKKRVTTVVMLVGIVLLGIEMIIKPSNDALGYTLNAVSIVMILGSFISLCFLNCHHQEETVEVGFNLIEMILDFFID